MTTSEKKAEMSLTMPPVVIPAGSSMTFHLHTVEPMRILGAEVIPASPDLDIEYVGLNGRMTIPAFTKRMWVVQNSDTVVVVLRNDGKTDLSAAPLVKGEEP